MEKFIKKITLVAMILSMKVCFSQTPEKSNYRAEKTTIKYSKVSERIEVRDNKGMLKYYIKPSKVTDKVEVRDKNNKLLGYYHDTFNQVSFISKRKQ